MADGEKQISKGGLEKLLKASQVCTTDCGTARQKFGEQVNDASNRGLNRFAFGVVNKLYKQDPAVAALNIRAIKLYIEHLDLDAQGDLEDVINDGDDDVTQNSVVPISEAIAN